MRKVLSAILLLGSLSARGQFAAQWNYITFVQNPEAIRQVQITALWNISVYGTTNLVTGQRQAKQTDLHGSLIISNMVPGAYKVDFIGQIFTNSFTNVFDVGTTGLVNAAGYIGISTNSVLGDSYAYTRNQVDALLENFSGGSATNAFRSQAGNNLITIETNATDFNYTISGVAQTNENMRQWGLVSPDVYATQFDASGSTTNVINGKANTNGAAMFNLYVATVGITNALSITNGNYLDLFFSNGTFLRTNRVAPFDFEFHNTNGIVTFGTNTVTKLTVTSTTGTVTGVGNLTIGGSAGITGVATVGGLSSSGQISTTSSLSTDNGSFVTDGSGDLTAGNISGNTISGDFTGDGSALTAINASQLSSGTVPPARLGSGSSITTKFLRGDSTWQSIVGGGDMLAANNLSDVANASTALANIGGNNAANLSAGLISPGRLPFGISNFIANVAPFAGMTATYATNANGVVTETFVNGNVLTNGSPLFVGGIPVVTTNQLIGASGLGAAQYAATDSGTNLVSTQNGINWTNTWHFTNFLAQTNIVLQSDGTQWSGLITNGPTVFITFAGNSIGPWTLRIKTNCTIVIPPQVHVLGYSNNVVTNALVDFQPFGGTNEVVEAIGEL